MVIDNIFLYFDVRTRKIWYDSKIVRPGRKFYLEKGTGNSQNDGQTTCQKVF